MPEEMPFTESDRNDYRWTDRAFDLLTEDKLTVSILGSGSSRTVRASGECPRCGHDVDFELPDSVSVPSTGSGHLGAQSRGPGRPADEYVPVAVACWCNEAHPGRPEAVKHGCGIVFGAEVLAARG